MDTYIETLLISNTSLNLSRRLKNVLFLRVKVFYFVILERNNTVCIGFH